MQMKERELKLQYPDKRTNKYIQEIQERLGVTKIQHTMQFIEKGLIGEFEGKRGDELTVHKHFNQFLIQFISNKN